jgi:hypothetical protein
MENVVRGPWPQSDAQERNSSFKRDQNEKRYAKAHQVWSELKDQARLPLADRKLMARNLGDLITELAADLGIAQKVALRQVWDICGPEHNWAKRLRYVRFAEDAEKKTDEYASSVREFANLARMALKLKPHNTVAGEDLEAEATLRLLMGTSYDPDPFKSAKIDFEAARAVAELAEAFIQQVENAVPGLKTYFERLAKYQLGHKPWPEQVYRERFLNSMRPLQKHEYRNWVRLPDESVYPADVDTSVFYGPFSGASLPSGLGNTFSQDFVFDGFDLWGDGRVNALSGLFPRIHLGDILGYHVVSLLPDLWETPVIDETGMERKRTCDEVWNLAPSHPRRLYLIIAPTKQAAGIKLQLGLLEEDWPCSGLLKGKDGHDYLPANAMPGSPEALGFGPTEPCAHSDLAWEKIVNLIPGAGSASILGLEGVSDIASAVDDFRDPLDRPAPDFDDLTPEFFAKRFLEVWPAIQNGEGFNPHPANTLASALFSNLLYVKGEGSVLNMMIADAKSRVDTLEGQFQGWMAEFEEAKLEFVNSPNKDA